MYECDICKCTSENLDEFVEDEELFACRDCWENQEHEDGAVKPNSSHK